MLHRKMSPIVLGEIRVVVREGGTPLEGRVGDPDVERC